ncbi:Ferredoxin--NADP reductase [Planctomycetes bacterium Pla163]|uniref:ferredoxin--NADP(+) reductase n=1 Tax=Rohdeia mirabilis TaxID=2528008 RepID=A0A518CZD2_9BACT|nr:Ferredoxin--NADP reductase [Planctomycetes bacterium Pla163]
MSGSSAPEELYNAEVVSNERLNDALFVLKVRPDDGAPDFAPGQFINIGLEPRLPEHAGRDGLVKRPYSIASGPSEPLLEFYVRLVENGALTPGLMALEPGDRLWADGRCIGRFTLDTLPEVPAPAERDLVCVATGTGLAPFTSMLREFGPARRAGAPDARFDRMVIVKGVRLAEDLGYAEELEAWDRENDWFTFVPLCSREPDDSGWIGQRGRVGQALESAAFEARCGFALDPARSQIMLCGNPAMVDELEASFAERGFKKHRPRDPGQVHLERYW